MVVSTLSLSLLFLGIITSLIAFAIIKTTLPTNTITQNWLQHALTPTRTPTSKHKLNQYIDFTIGLPTRVKQSLIQLKAEYLDVIEPSRMGKTSDEYVRLNATLKSDTEFRSPLTGTQSVLTSLKIERKQNNHWTTVYHGKQQTDDLRLTDGSGTHDVNLHDIDPQNITWTDTNNTTTITIPWDTPTTERDEYWNKYNHALPFNQETFSQYVQLGGVKITEHVFQADEPVIITGDTVEYANEFGWQNEITKEKHPFQIGGTDVHTVRTHAQLRTLQTLFTTGLGLITTGLTLLILSTILSIVL